MKLYRGPRTSRNWTKVDSKSASEVGKDWKPGKKTRMDGTIDKTGTRETDIGVEIESDDIIALSAALFAHQKAELKEATATIEELRTKLNEARETERLLKHALRKIKFLITYHGDEAESADKLVETVEKAAAHFYKESSRKTPFDVDWIDWDEI